MNKNDPIFITDNERYEVLCRFQPERYNMLSEEEFAKFTINFRNTFRATIVTSSYLEYRNGFLDVKINPARRKVSSITKVEEALTKHLEIQLKMYQSSSASTTDRNWLEIVKSYK